MNREDFAYLKHIFDAIAKIEKYLSGVNEQDFYENSLIQDGVIRQLEIIGEAVKRLSTEITKEKNLPWQDIAGMRDKLIHHYFGVDLETV